MMRIGSNKIDMISEAEIRKNLINSEIFDFTILTSTESTNNNAKISAEKGTPQWSVVIAESQTAGRGRMSRKFCSPQGTGVYMSIILRPEFSAENALKITTAAAVAVSKAIEKVTYKNTGIKWVNDIYIADKKICGILTEATASPDGKSLKYAILGIGINVFTPKEGFPDEIKEIAGAIFESGEKKVESRERLIAETLNEFEKIYRAFPDCDYMDYYRSHSILTGKAVNILKCGEICGEGIVEDIDDELRLVIKNSDGTIQKLSSGEVSVKKKE